MLTMVDIPSRGVSRSSPLHTTTVHNTRVNNNNNNNNNNSNSSINNNNCITNNALCTNNGNSTVNGINGALTTTNNNHNNHNNHNHNNHNHTFSSTSSTTSSGYYSADSPRSPIRSRSPIRMDRSSSVSPPIGTTKFSDRDGDGGWVPMDHIKQEESEHKVNKIFAHEFCFSTWTWMNFLVLHELNFWSLSSICIIYTTGTSVFFAFVTLKTPLNELSSFPCHHC